MRWMDDDVALFSESDGLDATVGTAECDAVLATNK